MGAHTLPYLRKEFASTVGCVLGFLDGGAVAPGPGERGRPGRRRVRPTPDLERFQRPPAGFLPSPREARGGAPEAGALPETHCEKSVARPTDGKVSKKLDFAKQKKGARPSRPCEALVWKPHRCGTTRSRGARSPRPPSGAPRARLGEIPAASGRILAIAPRGAWRCARGGRAPRDLSGRSLPRIHPPWILWHLTGGTPPLQKSKSKELLA